MKSVDILGAFSPFGLQETNDLSSNAVFMDDQPSKYNLFESGNHEEELFVTGQTVIWSSGQATKKKFTFPHLVTQATWASFDPNGPTTNLCVLYRGTASNKHSTFD